MARGDLLDSDYEHCRRVSYGQADDEYGLAQFVPVCETCGRFVKADASICFEGDTISGDPNATCSRCGRTHMLFEGFM